MNRVVDLFGSDVATRHPLDWKRIVAEQQCPFAGKKCFKVRKSQPHLSIGTCTMRHGHDSTPIMICPNRLLERQRILVDCLHLLQGHAPGNELHRVSEVSVPGGSVDYFLVSVLEGRGRDFVGIELQTLDTTGTVWPERQRLLQGLGFDVEDADVSSRKPCGMNWKMTAKTILVQLHHKARTFENLNRHLVLVVQDRLLHHMKREFNFEHLSIARNVDPMHFHSYRLSRRAHGHRIALAERYSTNTEGIAVCLGLQAEAEVELSAMVAAIEARISDATSFTVSGQADFGRSVQGEQAVERHGWGTGRAEREVVIESGKGIPGRVRSRPLIRDEEEWGGTYGFRQIAETDGISMRMRQGDGANEWHRRCPG